VFPYTYAGLSPTKASRREQIAGWIASKDNPYFARSYVNRVWSYLLGTGIIEPVDDIRAGNPPSNPQLLDWLTEEFVSSGFDVRKLMRSICQSRVYQQSIETDRWNQDDDLNYSHAIARRLPAEALYDAICRATGTVSQLSGMPAGVRAAQQIDSKVEVPSGFLDLFGRPARESACECERSGSIMLGPVLNLINGPIIADAIKDPNNRVSRLVASEKDDGKVIDGLFLSILCRMPTDTERAGGIKALRGETDEYNRMLAEHQKVKKALADYEKDSPVRQAAWEKSIHFPAWTVLEPTDAKASGKATLTRQPDGSLFATGANPTPEIYTVHAKAHLPSITAIRLEAMADSRLPAMGPGRAPNGNFVLSEFRVTAATDKDPKKPQFVALEKALADFSQESFAVAAAIDGNDSTGWAIAPASGRTHTALFHIKDPKKLSGEVLLTFTLEQRFAGRDHNIGRFRISVTDTTPPLQLDGPVDHIALILHVAPEKRSAAQKAELAAYFRSIDPELTRLTQALNKHPQPIDKRLLGAQDVAWALLNSPAFLFNH
jgi:hypothetical protein